MLFRVCRRGVPQQWVVLLGDGEYISKEQALLDAIEAASDARGAGNEAEVCDKAVRVY